jgi:hypothetical protein
MTELLMAHRIPASTTPLPRWLAEVADRVTLITSAEAYHDYRDAFPRVYAIPGYPANPVVEVLLEETCRTRQIGTLIHVTEDDILRCARVRERFGISGLRYPEAVSWRDKHLMKRLVRDRVRVAEFAVPADIEQALRFGGQAGYPVVVKPRTEFASHGVALAADPAELLSLVGSRDRHDLLLESFVAGRMLHIDGFTEHGKCLFALPSRYINSCLSFQETLPLGSCQLDPDSALFRQAVAFAEEVLAAMPPVDFCPFHLEAFQRQDGELVFCEIACRLGGAHIMEALSYATGVNPAELWIRHQAGLEDGPAIAAKLTPGERRYGWLLIPPKLGRLTAIWQPPPVDFIEDFIIKTPVPHEFNAASGSTDSYMAFVLSGRNHAALEASVRDCVILANELSLWEETND